MIDRELLKNSFRQRFATPAQWHSFAPGRVNLLGEHVDYLGGRVLPAAIDKGISITARFERSGSLEILAADFDSEVEWTASALEKAPAKGKSHGWQTYFWGCLKELSRLPGFAWRGGQLRISGDLPAGAGLSSSAAFEVATLQLFAAALGLELKGRELALAAQRVENLHVGTQCGIMDSFASVHGREGQFMSLDCARLEYTLHPGQMPGYSFILLHSMVSHELGDNYNRIRADLESAEKAIGCGRLVDLQPEQVEAARSRMSEIEYRRARYAVGEVARTKAFIQAISSGNAVAAGGLMTRTHEGLSRDLGVSTPELDALVELSRDIEGWVGGRMMGGGFGGCTLNLVDTHQLPVYLKKIRAGFEKRYNLRPHTYPVSLERGAFVEKIS